MMPPPCLFLILASVAVGQVLSAFANATVLVTVFASLYTHVLLFCTLPCRAVLCRFVYTPKGERAAGLVEAMKMIVAEKLRAKSLAIQQQQQQQKQQRVLPQQPGTQQLSSSSGQGRPVRMVRG
jgi:hypothetical protein